MTDEAAPWAEPAELASLRAGLSEVQQRIDRTRRQLELSAELEARLESMLASPTLNELLPPPSPARQAAELEATGILLQAELRAAQIIMATSGSGPSGAASGIYEAMSPISKTVITADVARVLENRLRMLADVEESLIVLGRRAVQREASPAAKGRVQPLKAAPGWAQGPARAPAVPSARGPMAEDTFHRPGKARPVQAEPPSGPTDPNESRSPEQ